MSPDFLLYAWGYFCLSEVYVPHTMPLISPLSGLPVNGVLLDLERYDVYVISAFQSAIMSSARLPSSMDLPVRL